MTLFGSVATLVTNILHVELHRCATWKIEVTLTVVACYITSTTVAMIRAVIAVHINAP